MAKVILKEKREIEGGYHIYRQPSPAGDLITVRRKVAMPSDVEHSSSKPTQRHRNIFSAASKRWAAIPAPVKAQMSNNYAWVPVQGHFAEADYKVLKGQQLFIAQEMHAEEYHDEHALLPWWLCIVTTDQLGRVIDIPLELGGGGEGIYTYYPRNYLGVGNNFFLPVLTGQQRYNVRYAETGWYLQTAFLYYEDELQKLRYQAVHPNITAAHAEYYDVRSHPTYDNWKPCYPPQPTDLAKYEVHQLISWHPITYHPETAVSLIWRRVDHAIHSLTIALHHLRYEMKVQLRHYDQDLTMWTIAEDPPGSFHLNPPQRTCRFSVPQMEILSYQD